MNTGAPALWPGTYAILFPATDSIPQSVVVLLCHPDSIPEDVDAYYLWFQSMRWTQRDLQWEVSKCRKVEVIVDGLDDPVVTLMPPGRHKFQLTYARITMRERPLKKVDYQIREHRMVLHFTENAHDIRYFSSPPAAAYPLKFECLAW